MGSTGQEMHLALGLVALCLIVPGTIAALLSESELLETAVYMRNYRKWNHDYVTLGPAGHYNDCGYLYGSSVCGCYSGGTAVECGESDGTVVPTVANGGNLPNYNPTDSSSVPKCTRRRGYDDSRRRRDRRKERRTAEATTSCSTGPDHELTPEICDAEECNGASYGHSVDGVTCSPPSKLYEAFHAGTAFTMNDQDGQAVAFTPTTTQFPFMEEGGYKGWVGGPAGGVTINLDKGRRRRAHADIEFGACARWEYGGYNEGDHVVLGNANTEYVTYQGQYNGQEGKSFQVLSGNIVLMDGILNRGTQHIRTSGRVNISGTATAVGTTINIGNSSSVFISDTVGAGTVNLIGVTASMYNVSTGSTGTVTMDGGTYLYVGGSNAGSLTLENNPTGTFFVKENSGTITCNSGTVTAIIRKNTGTITGSSGCTGTLTIMEDTGQVTVPSGVTLVSYSLSSEKLSQTLTVAGLATTDLEDTARIARLECEIATAIGASNCLQVLISSVNAARRTSVTITYEVTYQDAERGTLQANMDLISTDPSSSVLTAIVSALQSITGVTSITVTSTVSTTRATNCVCDGSAGCINCETTSSSSGTTLIIIIVCVVGGFLVLAAIGGLVAFFLMRQTSPVLSTPNGPEREGTQKVDVAPANKSVQPPDAIVIPEMK